MTQTIKRTLTRDMPNGDRIIAKIELRGDEGTLSPGFSLTGEIYEARSNASGATRQRMGRDIDVGGQIHDELIRAFPQLAPLAALHLSDPNGVPMHADANGWYFYSDAYQDKYETACKILRVDSIPDGLDRKAFSAFVDSQRGRWYQEANAGRALIESLPE
jgi:hypothetical protein